MSSVPLPEPHVNGWAFTTRQMRTHAAAVSAADNARLREALADLLSLYDQRIPLRERPTTWEAARAALTGES